MAGDSFQPLSTIQGFVKAEALSDFTPGSDPETADAFVERAKNEISIRDLLTKRGINATVFERKSETFPYVKELMPIGYRDPEMLRDMVDTGTAVVHVGGKVDIYTRTVQIPIEKTIAGIGAYISIKPQVSVSGLPVNPDPTKPAGSISWASRYTIHPFSLITSSVSFNTMMFSAGEGISLVGSNFSRLQDIPLAGASPNEGYGIDGTKDVNCFLLQRLSNLDYHAVITVATEDQLNIPSYLKLVGYIPSIFIARGAGFDYELNYFADTTSITDVPVFTIDRIANLDPVTLDEEGNIPSGCYRIIPNDEMLRFSTKEDARLCFITGYNGTEEDPILNRNGTYANIIDMETGSWLIDQIPLEIGGVVYNDKKYFMGQDFEDQKVEIDGNLTEISFGLYHSDFDIYPDQNYLIPINAILATANVYDEYTMQWDSSKITVYTMGELTDLIFPAGFVVDAYVPGAFVGDGSTYTWNVPVGLSEATVKVVYEQAKLDDMQALLSDDSERIINGGYLAKSFAPAFTWLEFSFYGADDVTVESVTDLAAEYLGSLAAGAPIEVPKIAKYLNENSAYVSSALTVRAIWYDYKGELKFQKSTSSINIERTSCCVPVTDRFSVTKSE